MDSFQIVGDLTEEFKISVNTKLSDNLKEINELKRKVNNLEKDLKTNSSKVKEFYIVTNKISKMQKNLEIKSRIVNELKTEYLELNNKIYKNYNNSIKYTQYCIFLTFASLFIIERVVHLM